MGLDRGRMRRGPVLSMGSGGRQVATLRGGSTSMEIPARREEDRMTLFLKELRGVKRDSSA